LTSDDLNWPQVTLCDLRLRNHALSHERKEKWENFTEKYTLSVTFQDQKVTKNGGVDYKNFIPKWILQPPLQFSLQDLGCWVSVRAISRAICQKSPIFGPFSTQNGLWSWSKPIYMNSQNEALDELVNIIGKKNPIKWSKKWSFILLLTYT